MTFPPEVIAAARASQLKWKIPASVILAQWALESNWGRTMPRGSNNPFGIKASGTQPFVTTATHEVLHGRRVAIDARFRRFDSIKDAFDDHGRLLATAGPYVGAMAQVAHPDAFADALTGHYATDPQYGDKLRSIMRSHNLYQYN